MYSTAYSIYQNTAVNTSTPQDLTLMLYNGIVRFIKQSIQAIDSNDIQKANDYNIRAQAIIAELMSSLNTSYEISNYMFSLYDYMNRRLIDANIKKDRLILQEVLELAESFRDTWAEAVKIAKVQKLKE